MGGTCGDAVTIRQDLFGRQGLARLKDPALDGTTESGGNLRYGLLSSAGFPNVPDDSSGPCCVRAAGSAGMRPLTVRAARWSASDVHAV